MSHSVSRSSGLKPAVRYDGPPTSPSGRADSSDRSTAERYCDAPSGDWLFLPLFAYPSSSESLGCAGPLGAPYPSVLGVEVLAALRWRSCFPSRMLGAYHPSLLIVPIMSNYLCAPI